MKTLIALTFTIIGALLLASPMIFTLLLAMCNRAAIIHADDRSTCQFGGGVLLLVGVIFAIFAFAAPRVPSGPAPNPRPGEK